MLVLRGKRLVESMRRLRTAAAPAGSSRGIAAARYARWGGPARWQAGVDKDSIPAQAQGIPNRVGCTYVLPSRYG